MSRLAIVLTALPGGGKNTVLDATLPIISGEQIETGAFFREISPELTKTGTLGSDDLANRYVEEQISKSKSSTIILNGYPRTEFQATTALKLLRNQGFRVVVVVLKVSKETSINRQLQRHRKMLEMAKKNPLVQVRPEDGNLSVVKKRTEENHDLIRRVLRILSASAVDAFKSIDAELPQEIVIGQFRAVVEQEKRKLKRGEQTKDLPLWIKEGPKDDYLERFGVPNLAMIQAGGD